MRRMGTAAAVALACSFSVAELVAYATAPSPYSPYRDAVENNAWRRRQLMHRSLADQVDMLRGEIAGLTKVLEQAERNGSGRCAPEEVRMGTTYLRQAA